VKARLRKPDRRVFSEAFKLKIAKRIEGGEPVRALSNEFKIKRTVLYRWRDAYRKSSGAAVSGSPGRPRSRAPAGTDGSSDAIRIAELERKVGQQTLQIDFLQRAFKRVKELRRRNTGSGGTASTERSDA
jgi:transposase